MSKQIRTTNPKQNRSERYQNKFRQPTQHKTDLQDIKTNSENQPNTKQICKISKQIRTTNPTRNRSSRYRNKFGQPTQHKTDLQDIKTNSDNQPNTKQICKISKQIRTTNPTQNRSARYQTQHTVLSFTYCVKMRQNNLQTLKKAVCFIPLL